MTRPERGSHRTVISQVPGGLVARAGRRASRARVGARGRRGGGPTLTLASCVSAAEPGPPGTPSPPPGPLSPARRPASFPAAAPPPPPPAARGAARPPRRSPGAPTPAGPAPSPAPSPPGPHPLPLQRLLLPRCIVGARSVVHLPFDLRQGLVGRKRSAGFIVGRYVAEPGGLARLTPSAPRSRRRRRDSATRRGKAIGSEGRCVRARL